MICFGEVFSISVGKARFFGSVLFGVVAADVRKHHADVMTRPLLLV